MPYFPMYPADFEADTSHLSLEEDGAYNRLLRLMWMTPGCSLPDDAAWIARRMRCDAATFNRVVSRIIDEFLTRKGGRIFSPRLRSEYEKADETYRRRSEAGKKGGRPKASESKREDVKAGLSQPKAGPKQPEPEPEPYKKEKGEIESRKRASAKTLIPSDAVLGGPQWAQAQAKGLSREEAEAQFERFRDRAVAKGERYADWNAAWRNWLTSPYFRPVLGNVTPIRGKSYGERLDDAFEAAAARLAVQPFRP